MYGNSADKSLIVCEAFSKNDYALRPNFIFTNILGMIAPPHLNHHHNFAEFAIDGNISEPDDVTGEERN